MRLTNFLPVSGMSAILRLAMRGSRQAFEVAARDPEQDGMRSRMRLPRPSDYSRPEFNKRCA